MAPGRYVENEASGARQHSSSTPHPRPRLTMAPRVRPGLGFLSERREPVSQARGCESFPSSTCLWLGLNPWSHGMGWGVGGWEGEFWLIE